SAVICWEDAREEIFKLIARAQASESQLKQIQSTSVNPFSRNTTKNRTPLEDATRKSKENSHAHSKQKAEETRSLPEPKNQGSKKKPSWLPLPSGNLNINPRRETNLIMRLNAVL
ncbi:hypothetical protein PCANC_28890, partial [Puccinia coronata f. sp. avenae]